MFPGQFDPDWAVQQSQNPFLIGCPMVPVPLPHWLSNDPSPPPSLAIQRSQSTSLIGYPTIPAHLPHWPSNGPNPPPSLAILRSQPTSLIGHPTIPAHLPHWPSYDPSPPPSLAIQRLHVAAVLSLSWTRFLFPALHWQSNTLTDGSHPVQPEARRSNRGLSVLFKGTSAGSSFHRRTLPPDSSHWEQTGTRPIRDAPEARTRFVAAPPANV
ncbi:hypothetical protein EYF80_028809 [Liparis tanakae]|uniref:Uncharacterized protein n=1 Tax=Liparis tanakae TaxID=230148 RepID=A0A4Z2H5W1_9TELE|nr:hypothetical protein EYF80_028809 [Liparis tanakae]